MNEADRSGNTLSIQGAARTAVVCIWGILALAGTEAPAVEHPFCLWTREEAAQLRKWIETDPAAKQQYERTMAKVAQRRKGSGLIGPETMDLFSYLVFGDKNAAERQKAALLAFAAERPEPMRMEFTLDEKNHRWAIGARSFNDRHHSRGNDINVLRYDVLYDELTPDQRRAVEDAFRLYIDFHLAGGKPWHPDFRYDRASWLPNMHWNRAMSTHSMAVALRDEKLVKAMFESTGGFKWFMDEYLGDGKFYMEEFCKYECMPDSVQLYCEALERSGLGEYGYGYTGANGGSARNFVEMYSRVGLPCVEQPGDRPWYPTVNMGDSGTFCNVPSLIMGGTSNIWGRTLFIREAFHRRFPDGAFDYFLARLREPGQDAYMPTPFFGLGPMDPKKVQPPPSAPSYLSRGRGFALLRAEEGPAYWESPKPAVALQFGMYYVHYVHDCFSILQYVANNRMIYTRVGKERTTGGYAGGDLFRDHVRGHCGVVVDGRQAQPSDDGNQGLRNHDLREDFAKPVKFVSGRTRGIYPDVDQERALFLTDEYLFDLFWLRSTGASSDKPRVYDWQVITFGETDESKSAPWVALDAFADKPRAAKILLEDIRVMDAGEKPWTVTAVFEPGNAVSPGVRVSMLGEKGTLVLSSITPPDRGYAANEPEQRGRSILATRNAPATTFVALHEPFKAGIGSHAIEKFDCMARTDSAVAVRIAGKPGSGIDDRILLRYGDGADAILDVGDKEESYSFADHAYLRIGPDVVNVVGKVRKLSVPVKGNPKLIVNGKERSAQIAGGILKAEFDDVWPALPRRGEHPGMADTPSLSGLLAQLHGDHVARREAAAAAIGRMGAAGKEAIPALVRCLKEKVRLQNKAAPAALAAIGPDAIPALIEALKFDDPYARYEAIAAIRLMGPNGKPAVPALSQALDDENSYVRIHACLALYGLDSEAKAAIPALVAKLDDRAIDKHAAFALTGLGADAAAALTKALDEAPRFSAAAWGIEQMGEDAADAVPALVKALTREGQFSKAASALGRIGPKAAPAVPVLIHALDDVTNRPSAVAALGNIGPAAQAAVPALIRVVPVVTADKAGRTNRTWSAAAIRALGQIGPGAGDAAPLLTQILQDPTTYERPVAAVALGAIGPQSEGVLPAMAACMKDRDPRLREAAGTALAGFGDGARTVAPSLKERLSDADVTIRLDSAWVLLRIGAFQKEARTTFVEALESRDAKVCLPALNKAEKLGAAGADLLPVVNKLANREDKGLRDRAMAAAAALQGRNP
jgi:HEAT repeat protein